MSFQTLRLPRLSQLWTPSWHAAERNARCNGPWLRGCGLLQVTENDCTSSLQANQEGALSSSKREVPSKIVQRSTCWSVVCFMRLPHAPGRSSAAPICSRTTLKLCRSGAWRPTWNLPSSQSSPYLNKTSIWVEHMKAIPQSVCYTVLAPTPTHTNASVCTCPGKAVQGQGALQPGHPDKLHPQPRRDDFSARHPETQEPTMPQKQRA